MVRRNFCIHHESISNWFWSTDPERFRSVDKNKTENKEQDQSRTKRKIRDKMLKK